MSTNEDLLSAAIRHATHNARYGRGLAAKIVKLLDGADADMMGTLADRLARIEGKGFDTGPATTARLQAIIEALKSINDEVYKKMASTLVSELEDFAIHEAEYVAKNLAGTVAIDIRAKVPTAPYLRTLVEHSPVHGYVLKSWFDEMPKKRLGRIEQQVRIGLVQGETIDQVSKRVRAILPISRQSAQTVAVTAASTVANMTRDAVYRENSDIIKAVQWVSTLDTRTSSECQSLDGQVWPVDDPHPQPPVHPNCRSILVPVAKSWQEMGLDKSEADEGVRASMDGQVPASTTYPDWLKGQSEEVQADVLGVERAKLFRDGKITGKDLYRDDGTYRSLDELKKRLSR